MKGHHRQIIKELAEFFGLKSHSIDKEPLRSVVVKATKEKCYLPTVSIMDVVKKPGEKTKTTTQSTKKKDKRPKEVLEFSENEETAEIDYFDFSGD